MLGGIWGQTRCSIYQSETSNVKRSTLNFQRDDRKGARWAGYGDRHGVLPVGGANRGTGTIFGPGGRIFDTSELTQRPAGRSNRAAAPTYGDRHDVRYTDRERSTSNVQRSTFKGLTERAHAGRDMGTDTEFCRSAVQKEGQADIWSPGFLTPASPSACQPVETDWDHPLPPKKGTDTEFHNVRATGLLTHRT